MLEALLAAAASLQAPAAASFTEADFVHAHRLVGRWEGRGPDGQPFYEEYDLPDRLTLRSRRYSGADFATVTDASSVRFEDGAIVSRWGRYSWRAVAVTPDLIRFEPVNAPSHFSWRFVDTGTVEVRQDWRDAQGAAQSYTLRMTRLPMR
jgi:hypothetical protein